MSRIPLSRRSCAGLPVARAAGPALSRATGEATMRASMRLLACWLVASVASAQGLRTDKPAPAADAAARPAAVPPLALRVNCAGESAIHARDWGGSNLPVVFDDRGRARVDLRVRRNLDVWHGPYLFSVCIEPTALADVRWTVPGGVEAMGPLGYGGGVHWFKPALAGDEGRRGFKLGIAGQRTVAGRVAAFDGAIDVDIDYGMSRVPVITAIETEDYRPGRAGVLTNAGVLDPALLARPDALAGRFTIVGRHLHGNGTVVRAGGATAVVEQQGGGGDAQKLVVRVAGLSDGTPLTVERHEVRSRPFPVRRLTYRTLGVPEDLQPLLAGLRVVLGSPRGSGQVTVDGRTTPLRLPAVVDERGLTLHLNELRSTSATATFSTAGDGAAAMTLDVSFESDGDELGGTLLSEIDVFRCGTFQIDAARCTPLTASCIRQALGDALAGAAACAQPSAWGPQRVRGPDRPVRGNVDDARLTLWIKFAPNAAGASTGALDRVEFTARVGLQAGGVTLPLSADDVQARLQREIRKRLFDDLAARDAWQRIADVIHAAMVVNVRQPLIRGYYPLRGGSGLFADLEAR